MLVLKQITLGPHHTPTGNTRHFYGTHPVPAPAKLRITQFSGDPGFYLLYLDREESELTDTYHSSLDDAMAQAEFEFNVKPIEWENLPG